MDFNPAAFSDSVMNDPLVRDVWDRKYRYRELDGSSTEMTVADTRARVVNGVYALDPDADAKTDAMEYVQRGLLIPAGRVNAGAGLDRDVTLINCFVSETIQDSMTGIQRAIGRAALTMQQGGGIGSDYSTIRPAGALVKRTGSVSSGMIPFADQQDAMCRTVVSAGTRRGAMMLTLRDDHPDLWNEDQFETMTGYYGETVLKSPSFISVKRQPGRLTQFNVSVLVSDAFLKAVEADADWDLGFHVPRADGRHVAVYDKPFPYDSIRYDNEGNSEPWTFRKGDMLPWYVYRRVKAKRIWDDIMRSTYTYAEPGVIFIDRINERNNLWFCEDIRTTNPCAEQPLPPHGICCLSSVNLAFMVEKPFTDQAEFNFWLFRKVVSAGVRFLDNVLDVTKYPLADQLEEARAKRRVGLGITGFGDALAQMGIVYGSKDSVKASRSMARVLFDTSYMTSALLAKERGPFPLFDRDKFLDGYNAKKLSLPLRDLIAAHGIRNGVLNTIAPNGTISLYVGNVSSGHEPVFSFDKAVRKVRQNDGTLREYESMDYALRLFESMHGVTAREDLPACFVGAMDISPREHLLVHAAWQEYIDSSISKTINCPGDMTFEEFGQVYSEAYSLGCKGCTTYRPDPASGRGSVLSVSASAAAPNVSVVEVIDRPGILEGRTYKLKWPQTGKNWYVTINSAGERPLEMFIVASEAAAQEWVTAMSRTITAILRRGGDVRFLIEQLSEVPSATGGAFIAEQKRFRSSVVAAIGGILEMEMSRLRGEEIELHTAAVVAIAGALSDSCPGCGNRSLVREGGCTRCLTCGHNSCG